MRCSTYVNTTNTFTTNIFGNRNFCVDTIDIVMYLVPAVRMCFWLTKDLKLFEPFFSVTRQGKERTAGAGGEGGREGTHF